MKGGVSITGYGHDIARERADDLDKKMLVRVSSTVSATVLDMGCGAGGQSLRLAQVGARVTGIDTHDFSATFTKLRTTTGLSAAVLQFVHSDIGSYLQKLENEKYDYAVLQRMIHYLPYPKALSVLQKLRQVVRDRLYISVSGVESDIGEWYPCASQPLAERFCKLQTAEAQEGFAMTEALCLYAPEECIGLLGEAGWEIEECWVSAFGNCKAVCF